MSNRNKILHYIYISSIIVIIVVGFGQYIYINNTLSNYVPIHVEHSLSDMDKGKSHISDIDLNDTNRSLRSLGDSILDGNVVTFLITLVFSVLALNIFAVQKDVRDLIEKHNDTVTDLRKSLQQEINNFSKEILNYKSSFDNRFLNIQKSLNKSLDSQSKENEEMLLKFEKRIDNIQHALDESKEIVSNDMDSAEISIQFKSLFLESLFFSLSLKFSDYEVNPKFAELVYYMDKRRNSIDNFLSQKRNFKIKSETQNDIFESLINTIRNIEIVKIKKNTKNNGKTVLYEALVIDLEELLKKVRKLNINDTLHECKK